MLSYKNVANPDHVEREVQVAQSWPAAGKEYGQPGRSLVSDSVVGQV
jgi:hypothetical protein